MAHELRAWVERAAIITLVDYLQSFHYAFLGKSCRPLVQNRLCHFPDRCFQGGGSG